MQNNGPKLLIIAKKTIILHNFGVQVGYILGEGYIYIYIYIGVMEKNMETTIEGFCSLGKCDDEVYQCQAGLLISTKRYNPKDSSGLHFMSSVFVI